MFKRSEPKLNGLGLERDMWPKKISIGLNDKCNLRCKFCSFHMYNRPGENIFNYKEMTDDVFERILPAVRHAETVKIAGMGEPTIAKDFVDKVEKIKEVNPSCNLVIITNALRFADRRFAERTLKFIDELDLSFHGIKSYESVMVNSSKDVIKSALLNISEMKKKYGKPYVGLGFVILRDNADDIVNMKHLAKKLDFDRVQYKELRITAPALKSQSFRFDPELKHKVFLMLKRARDEIDLKQDNYPFLLDREIDEYFGIKEKRGYRSRKKRSSQKKTVMNGLNDDAELVCSAPWDTAMINSSGRIKLCCYGNTTLGSLEKSSFEDLWFSEELLNYRRGILTKDYYKSCSSCFVVKNDNVIFNNYRKKMVGSNKFVSLENG